MQKRAYVKESSFDAQERADVEKPSCDVRGRPDVDEVLFGVRERVDARKASGEIQGRKSTLVRMSEEPVRRKATLAHLFYLYACPQISPYAFVVCLGLHERHLLAYVMAWKAMLSYRLGCVSPKN